MAAVGRQVFRGAWPPDPGCSQSRIYWRKDEGFGRENRVRKECEYSYNEIKMVFPIYCPRGYLCNVVQNSEVVTLRYFAFFGGKSFVEFLIYLYIFLFLKRRKAL